MKRLTLEEIGRIAGVSRSTVSRVVNGHRDVSPAVKERVLAVINETGFSPNQAARSLVSRRTGLIGLVIPSDVHSLFADPYFGRLIQGITKAANATQQTLSLFLFEDEREELELYPRVITNGLLDGVIVTATRMGNPLVERLAADRTPFVMVGRPDADGIPYVDVENRDGACEATRHLIVEHGKTRLATVAAPDTTTTGRDRLAGFMDATTDAGIDVPSGRIAEGDFSEESGFTAMIRLLAEDPDAVFCASDTMAVGALRALESKGIRCPEDVAVVSFDGLVEPQDTTPPLTTMAQPAAGTGAAAVALLLEVLDGEGGTVQPKILPTELIVRASCGCSEESVN